MTHNNMTATLGKVITRLSPAKINLFLHITGKRADGYHDLQTVFRLLDWGDCLHFLALQPINVTNIVYVDADIEQQATHLCAKLIVLDGANNITDSLADNLIIKAAHSLLSNALSLQQLPEQLSKVSITLDKRLPIGAGLGGGSSNAATTLLTLNEIWQLSFTNEQLRAIGKTLGADVPIFIYGQDAIAMGIGEQLTPIVLPNQQYLVLTPNTHINTAELFTHSQLRRGIIPLSVETIKNQTEDYIQNLSAPYENVFTPVVTSLAIAVEKALSYLQSLELQALGVARMTGSGSAVFLPLDDSITDSTQLLTQWIEQAPCPAYIVNNLRI